MPPGRRCGVGAAAAGLALLAAVSVGCAGSGGDKAGGPDDRTIVLTLAAGDPNDAFVNFAAAVESESRGALRIVARVGWRASSPDPERARIADVRSGAVDLAEVGAGAWDAVGVTSFRALVAPLLIDALALQARVLETSSIATMLEGVRPLGLVGLAVLPGELRRPFGTTRPLVAPKDYSGARLPAARDVAAATWEALGGDPVDSSAAVRLDGAAHDLPTIDASRLDVRPNVLTANVVLWPPVRTIVANRRAYSRLTPAQRDALRRAGRAAITPAFRRVEANEIRALARICGRGRLRLVSATAAELAALHRAVRPVYALLERDPRVREQIATIRRMRERKTKTRRRPLRARRARPHLCGSLAARRQLAHDRDTGRAAAPRHAS